MQMIKYLSMAFKSERVGVWIHTYKILSTSQSTGLIQLIPNAVSLDGLKKSKGYPGSLRGYFEQTFGAPGSPGLEKALDEFVKSLAGNSIVAYLLAIKDRFVIEFWAIVFCGLKKYKYTV